MRLHKHRKCEIRSKSRPVARRRKRRERNNSSLLSDFPLLLSHERANQIPKSIETMTSSYGTRVAKAINCTGTALNGLAYFYSPQILGILFHENFAIAWLNCMDEDKERERLLGAQKRTQCTQISKRGITRWTTKGESSNLKNILVFGISLTTK
mmetsp:Transcript_28987/g.67563  ORF Transcript_28987/g.67563 Transcript_28987/m.67563 type:complete len:154 (+) Transcript_28987:1076-1537(+)